MPRKFFNTKKMKKSFLLTLLFALGALLPAKAQDVAVKTNLLYDALLNVNLGMEFKTAPRWTFDINGNYNGWTLSDNKKWKHWMVQPEMRYWLCEAFHGNFFGLEAHGGQYNIGHLDLDFDFLGTDFRRLLEQRYQGWYAGAGVTWGHAWILGQHWNFEAEIGLGWSYTRSDVYPCAKCGKKIGHKVHNYVGPTKAALNVVYLF